MTIQTLTAEQIQLLENLGFVANEYDKYYHLPQFFRRINETDFEVLFKEDLPVEVKILFDQPVMSGTENWFDIKTKEMYDEFYSKHPFGNF